MTAFFFPHIANAGRLLTTGVCISAVYPYPADRKNCASAGDGGTSGNMHQDFR